MPLGPFDPIPQKINGRPNVVRVEHINDMRAALTGLQDAYDVAVANGFSGTHVEWLQSLIGPQGKPGTVPVGSATTASALPLTGNTLGDVRTTDDTGHAHRWSGSAWIDIGQWRGDPGELVKSVADTYYAAKVATEATLTTLTTAITYASAYSTLAAALAVGAGGTVIIDQSQTVPAGTTIPAKTRVLVAPGVVLTRAQPTVGTWIAVGADAILDGGEYNGNKAAAASFSRGNYGISLAAGAALNNAVVRDNNGHGIRYLAGSRSRNVVSTGHGDAPGASGTGDGFYIADVLGVELDACTAGDNARIGITVTSNTAPTSAVLRNCNAGTDNGYLDLNIERAPSGGQAVTARLSGITGGGASTSGATLVMEDADIERISTSTTLQGDTDVTLRRVRLAPTGVDEIGAEIYARRIVLDDVTVTVNRTTGWGAAFYSAGAGYAHRVTLAGTMYQGLLFSSNGGSWEAIATCGTDAGATVTYPGAARRVGVRTVNGGGLRFLNLAGGRFVVTERRFRLMDTAAPAGGAWSGSFDAGDIAEHSAPAAGGVAGWVCVTAGSPGTWKTYGAIAP